MTVELVSVERELWSGKASFVFARTTVGEIGVLPGHEPTLAQLEEAGIVRIDGTDGSSTTAAVHGGFLHITP
jgi:F-type H+-transporting ATPase subunit epsilon